MCTRIGEAQNTSCPTWVLLVHKVDGHEGIIATTETMTMQPRLQKIWQAIISALGEARWPLGCCELTGIPYPGYVN